MKHKKIFHRAFSFLLAILMCVTCLGTPVVNAAESSWTLKGDTEIFLVTTTEYSDELKAQVKLFASELAEKVTGTALPISYGDDDEAGTNDIILALDTSSGITAEGYDVKATSTSIKISASDADGLFYGCRYLIKELLLDDAVDSISDAPHVAERAVSLDNGRKYFTVEWIKEFIREMSWANMNTLALHFSEEMGLGIESKLYPWLNGRDGTLCTQAEIETDNRYLTQEEVKEIVKYAKLYHIDVVPSLDSPGHMNYIVKKFNEKCATEDYSFTYDDKIYTAEAGTTIGNYFSYNGVTTAVVPGSRNGDYSRGIDISNEIAVAFTKSLIKEYGTLFANLGCTKFDIGGDELLGWGSAAVSTSTASRWKQLDHWKAYAQERTGNSNAVAYDAFLLYMNDLNALVRELGYTSVRMWNDDALRKSDTGWTGVVQLDTDIDIWFWTTGNNIFYDYASADYQLYNILSDYNYYAMTNDYFSSNRGSFAQAYADEIYNEWTPYIFYPADLNAGWKYNPGQTNPNVLGGAFGIWCDNPTLKTEDEVMADLLPLIRANAAKSWDPNANSAVSYTAYAANWTKYGNAPAGTVTAGDIYVVADLTELAAAVEVYETVDGTLYTDDSYAAYTEAVDAGKQLLTADKPAQSAVDAAVAAINEAKEGLTLLPAADITALEAAIAEYEAMDASLYTEESFAMYAGAVEDAKLLLASGAFTQEQVDAALEAIEARKGELRTIDTVSSVECFISGKFKSSKVYIGKVATMNISAIKGRDIVDFEIYNEAGTIIEVVRQVVSTKKSDRDNWTIIISPTEAEVGTQTYTVYAVFSDGTRSADCLQMSINVISTK